MPASGAKAFAWRGVHVSSDASAVRPQLERLVATGGLNELREWYASFFGLDTNQKKAIALGLDLGDIAAFDGAVRDAKGELEKDATTFVENLKPSADAATVSILDESKERIERELEAYGIAESTIPPDPGGGGAEGGPGSYETRITVGNVGKAREAQLRARDLAALRRSADKARLDFMKHVQIPGATEVEKAVRSQVPDLESGYRLAEDDWKMGEAVYAKQAMAAVRDFPVIAMYASGADAATSLEAFASQPVESLGETVWREARTRLENIETIRGGLGGKYNPLFNAQVVRLVLDKGDIKPWQKRVGKDHVDSVRAGAEQDKMFWTTIAIGLGIVAAIPTGGSSLAAVAGGAATVAGAALSAYNLYEHWIELELGAAGANTDFAKAKSLSQDDPSYLWLALDLIGAGLDVVGAGAPFKKLIGIIAEARTTKDVVRMARAVDAVAPPGVAAKVKARVAEEIGPDAVTKLVESETKGGAVAKQAEAAAEAERTVATVVGDSSPEIRKAAMLDDPESLKKLVETAGKAESPWCSLYKTPEERADSLLKLVNARLQAAGVTPISAVELVGGTGGAFSQRTWRMELSKTLLAKAKTEEDFARLLNYSYHEARHAEQFFLIARREAGVPGRTVDDLVKPRAQGGLGLHPTAADAAFASKLSPESAEAIKAADWFESVYGAGRQHRADVYKRLDEAAAAFKEKKALTGSIGRRIKRGGSDLTLGDLEAAKAEMETAYRAFGKAHEAYKKLPEEADAWRIGELAERMYLDWRRALDDVEPITVRYGRR